MKLKLSLLMLLFMVSSAKAFFDFDSYVASPLTWNPGVVNPTYTFTVNFRSYCNSGCVGQEYRLALSDENPGSQSSITPGTEPVSYDATELSDFLLSASFSQGSNSGALVPGEWTHDQNSLVSSFFDTNVDTIVTGTFSFVLDSNRLQQLPSGTYNLDFYIAGEDMYQTRHLDSIFVRIPIEIPELTKVSGLKDITLNASNLNGNNLDADQQVCVFSNTGGVTLDFDGSSDPGNYYMLSKSGQCNQPGDCVGYRMRAYTPSENRWLTYRFKGQRSNDFRNAWTASSLINCNGGTNMTLRVRMKRKDVQASEAGLFSDTMTITVSPL
ncbi:MAG: hypothetical protein ACR2PX_02305 [Endozoicomonas sp.]|uniref:hypothetical protein n=1 Tax=Endozoicomonas sp. TaxID=1892382 RepID=UPI003D9B763E